MTIHQILQTYWGFSSFRSLQEEVIQSVLDGRDTLALMPTGGGKSVCFQVPALLKPGICIVVSPLIALMKDQVENLKSKGIKAIAIISGMGKREVDIALDNCIYGDIKFLYLSPERLLSDLVRERIRHMKVNLIAVDEAHCIAQWGYDFRPPYMHIADLREIHPDIPVLALTATATADVAQDIQKQLRFKTDNIFRKSFERKNLGYVVVSEENKLGKLLSIARKIAGSGIIYVRNRRQTQEIARQLGLQGISADYYHAGIDTPSRTQKQLRWKQGLTRIMVATNAFGMGIDKPDVRFVIHLDLPESLEAYYQEAGRAGRDEKKAFAILLFNASDEHLLLKRFEESFPTVEEIKQVYHALGNYFQLAIGAGEGLSLEFDIAEFCARFQLEAIKTINALKFLERDEYIVLSETVFLPSRVQFVCGHEALYHFQVEQPAYDQFIKTLLRSYGGIFDQYVAIKESDLAKRTGLSRPEVISTLQKLQGFQLLQYIPQTDKPHIEWIKARVDFSHLFINGRHIAERQQVTKTQLECLLGYVKKPVCRSLQLLRYFDDHDSRKCGVCDVCLDEKRARKHEIIATEISREIFDLLSSRRMLLSDLITSLSVGDEAMKLAVVRELIDAGKLKSDADWYFL
ncbi:RecQ family ATP-dependent DNA helicase [Flavihumibacter sp. R14]|nr:RecQ family ATP-dependent DNA helicase [Flavihumibacter soli]